jgi:hypothetical protein
MQHDSDSSGSMTESGAEPPAQGATQDEVSSGSLGASGAEAWRPIETAPKGDANLLLTDGRIVSAGGWTTDMDCGAEYEGQIGMAGWWWIEVGECKPTHWMPLPQPPSAAIEAASEAPSQPQASEREPDQDEPSADARDAE